MSISEIDKKNTVVSTQYAVEVNNEKTYDFLRQIEIFDSYEEANNYVENHQDCKDGEYYNIIFIDYNIFGDEVQFGTVC